MERHIGLDAHAMSCAFGVISERGRRLKSAVVETNARALVDFIETIPGRKHLCLEEGTLSGWLYEILSPHVAELVVTHIRQESRGRKDDLTDAFARAEELRVGSVTPVFKDGGRMGQLRSLVDVHGQVTRDLVRVQNRLKALYRSRGVSTPGGTVYTEKHREQFLVELPKVYRPSAVLRHRARDVEEPGGLRPGEASHQTINTRRWERADARPSRDIGARQLPASSTVRGKASIMRLDHGLVPKSPRIGYASSEYQPIRWPRQALIEGWCPLRDGAHTGIGDDWEAELADGSGRVAALTPRHPVARRQADAVRQTARWWDRSVLDLPFHRRSHDRPLGSPLSVMSPRHPTGGGS
jgi:hypothetical protein